MNLHSPPAPSDPAGEALMKRLHLLHDETALSAVVGHQPPLIESLRAMLFEREPSGIYQPRCRAATALGMIGAFPVLLDFLSLSRPIEEPVERSGEDAVINAAAKAVAKSGCEEGFDRLRQIAGDHPHLIGVVEALGSYERSGAIPELVAALVEDGSRHAAEQALVAISDPAIPALVEAALDRPPEGELEYSIETRKRRSALKVLIEIGAPAQVWTRLRPLMADADKWISAYACQIALRLGSWQDQEEALERLQAMRRTADIWLLFHIDDLLDSTGTARGAP